MPEVSRFYGIVTMASISANGIEVAVASSVDDELVAAFSRLIPQLSRSAAVPTPDLIREIVEAQASTVVIARDLRDNGRIVGMLTLVVFRIPTGVRAWIEDVVVDETMRGRGSDRRSHISTRARGGKPTLSAVRIYPTRQQCVPLHPVTAA